MGPQETVAIGLSIFSLSVFCLPLRIWLSLLVGFLGLKVYQLYSHMGPNPFSVDARKPRKPYIIDQKQRDAVIKQSFNQSKVPESLDAIVIGSGIGGLTTAVLMAKSGKKVLVLEQHDQAGGCCHTFIDKGYEFDVGIHYIGEVGPGRLNKTLVDQITDGQVEWARLEHQHDIVTIGYGDKRKDYPIVSGKEEWRSLLLKQFPAEKDAIDTYLSMVEHSKSFDVIHGAMKLIPLWLAWIVVKLGLLNLFSPLWSGLYKRSTMDVVKTLTSNKDLQTIFTYCWGDFGTSPKNSHFAMQGLLSVHFMDCGGYYPVGGASEIAFNMIPIIEQSGGKVLVRADVTQILCNKENKAHGIVVKKGSEEYNFFAPLIISNAGAYNTFQTLLPKEIAVKSYYHSLLKDMKPGLAAMSIFVGLNASNEELGLKAQNTWAFTSNAAMDEFDNYLKLDKEEVQTAEVPLVFVSFPSAKDPNWRMHPGRESKSTCAIITLATWDWYKKWESKPLKRRGDDYDAIKKAVGDQMIEQTCKLFPQIRHHIDYIEIGTPVTNKHYLAQPHGEIYGLDHSFDRLQPWTMAQLRPQTDIEGLYLTGQDACLCGFTGALFGGLLCAGVVLGRNAMGDLESLHDSLAKK